MQMNEKVFPDLDSLSRAALGELLQIVRDAAARNGRCALALSGGTTPNKMYDIWAAEHRNDTPWEKLHLFWGDERYVPPTDSLSNFREAREKLISRVPIPPQNVHPVPTILATPALAAEAYEKVLRQFFGAAAPAFDLQLQGLGVEGHTASLFPGSPVLAETQKWVAPVEVAAVPPRRITFTPVVLNAARRTFFLVSCSGKREIIAALRNEKNPDSSEYPAARLHPAGPVTWFLDRAAVS